jgi:hypothetical protein
MRFKAALLRREATRSADLARAYGLIWRGLQGQIRDLIGAVEAGERSGDVLARARALSRQVEDEVGHYAAYADQSLLLGMEDAIELGARYARGTVRAGYPVLGDELIRELWNQLPAEAIETILGMTAPGSPLRGRMSDLLGEAVADAVRDSLAESVALGRGPREIQALLRARFGQGLEWSLTSTRTATQWAYREAQRASYAANPRMVKDRYRWTATKDARTCLSCIARDGELVPLDNPLQDHYNGRCQMVPVLATYRELGIPLDEPDREIPTARSWFEAQPAAVQRQMMGAAAWEEWRAGKFDLRDYPKASDDPVYGRMFAQRPLRELLGAAA